MGLTQHSLDKLNKLNVLQSGLTMLELGCQNMYDSANYNRIAKEYFEEIGIKHISIDTNGEQGSIVKDLRTDLSDLGQFDIVTDYGTLEHLDGNLYQGFKNVHNCTKKNGIIMHELPKTGHWPLHGNAYFDQKFFEELAAKAKYEVLYLGENGNVGNWDSGIVISVIFKKLQNNKFISKTNFDLLKVYEN